MITRVYWQVLHKRGEFKIIYKQTDITIFKNYTLQIWFLNTASIPNLYNVVNSMIVFKDKKVAKLTVIPLFYNEMK